MPAALQQAVCSDAACCGAPLLSFLKASLTAEHASQLNLTRVINDNSTVAGTEARNSLGYYCQTLNNTLTVRCECAACAVAWACPTPAGLLCCQEQSQHSVLAWL